MRKSSQALIWVLVALALATGGFLLGRSTADDSDAFDRGRASGLIDGQVTGRAAGIDQARARFQQFYAQCGQAAVSDVLSSPDPSKEPWSCD